MMFTWLADFWSRALSDEGSATLGTSKVPQAAAHAPFVIKRCLEGRGAAGGALTITGVQLPFPYVHLLSMLVQVACVVNAMVQGAATGWLLSESMCPRTEPTPSTEHHFRYDIEDGCQFAMFVQSPFATVFILLGLLMSVVIYPVIYHGLLSIGVMLANPLGSDFIDFPGSFYQHIMQAEFRGFHTVASSVNLKTTSPEWWKGVRKVAK